MQAEEFRREMLEVGLNVSDMIEHFMDNEDMFMKYLTKFFDAADGVVLELSCAEKNGDLEKVFSSAHALKGLAGNIGLNGVYIPAKEIVDDMRAGVGGRCGEDIHKITSAYSRAKDIITKYVKE